MAIGVFDRIAFTGAATVSQLGVTRRMRDLLYKIQRCHLDEPSWIISGGAEGIDTIAARAAWAVFPNSRHRLVVPLALSWNRDLVSSVSPIRWTAVDYVPGDYMDRNDALVANATVLLAFPQTGKELLRSGTWATIRRARKLDIPVHIFPLNEFDNWRFR